MDTISFAYEHSTQETIKLEGITGHQVRGLAASWAYFKNTSLSEIRNAVGWKSASVFAQHYLWDVGADDMFSGPLVQGVAAAQVLSLCGEGLSRGSVGLV